MDFLTTWGKDGLSRARIGDRTGLQAELGDIDGVYQAGWGLRLRGKMQGGLVGWNRQGMLEPNLFILIT